VLKSNLARLASFTHSVSDRAWISDAKALESGTLPFCQIHDRLSVSTVSMIIDSIFRRLEKRFSKGNFPRTLENIYLMLTLMKSYKEHSCVPPHTHKYHNIEGKSTCTMWVLELLVWNDFQECNLRTSISTWGICFQKWCLMSKTNFSFSEWKTPYLINYSTKFMSKRISFLLPYLNNPMCVWSGTSKFTIFPTNVGLVFLAIF
jgi:hypothetical protein